MEFAGLLKKQQNMFATQKIKRIFVDDIAPEGL